MTQALDDEEFHFRERQRAAESWQRNSIVRRNGTAVDSTSRMTRWRDMSVRVTLIFRAR